MEASRLAVRELLFNAMTEAGEEPVLYYQPPATVKMQYPCIVYHLKDMPSEYANDHPYIETISFDATYISRSPSSKVPIFLSRLMYSNFDRYYTADNLHHYSYTITTSLKEE